MEDELKRITEDARRRFGELVRDIKQQNADRDLGIFEPFLLKARDMLEPIPQENAPVPEMGFKKPMGNRICELLAVEFLLESVKDTASKPRIIQRLNRLREAGFHDPILVS